MGPTPSHLAAYGGGVLTVSVAELLLKLLDACVLCCFAALLLSVVLLPCY
jgi:hypothetical protein